MHPEALQQALAPYTGELGPGCLAQVGGGSINHSFVLTSCAGRQFFLKTNVAARLAMFEAEADGLAELAAAAAVRVPAAIASGIAGDRCWLLLEYLELGSGGERAAGTLGRQLASQHRRTAGHFGWHRDNTIGSTPQSNTPGESWADFFRDQRLAPQLQLVGATGASSRLLDLGARTCAAVPSLLADHRPAPALLHGDLWGGNWAETRGGQPVIFDPSVYYGDREADLAMTRLFGGFPAAFYRSYESAWPLPPGHDRRRTLYNLYHVLNHLNLFGGGYAAQAEHLMRELLE